MLKLIQKVNVIVMLLAITTSCSFNQSYTTDLSIGATSRGDGIGVGAVIMEINGEIEARNEYTYGEEVNVIFENVTGLMKVNGFTFPKMSIFIIKNDKDTVDSNLDLLEDLVDGTDHSPLRLNTYFTCTYSYKNNEKYEVFVEIGDRKGNGTFKYSFPFTIKAYDMVEIKNSGFEYSEIYLWNETSKFTVTDNSISAKDEFYLILEEIKGFELVDGKVFPEFSVELRDKGGEIIVGNPNLFEEYLETGMDPADIESQIYASLTFTKGYFDNPCRFTAKLKDLKSDKKIIISTLLDIKAVSDDNQTSN